MATEARALVLNEGRRYTKSELVQSWGIPNVVWSGLIGLLDIRCSSLPHCSKEVTGICCVQASDPMQARGASG